jgi:hypothetical protein
MRKARYAESVTEAQPEKRESSAPQKTEERGATPPTSVLTAADIARIESAWDKRYVGGPLRRGELNRVSIALASLGFSADAIIAEIERPEREPDEWPSGFLKRLKRERAQGSRLAEYTNHRKESP